MHKVKFLNKKSNINMSWNYDADLGTIGTPVLETLSRT